MRQLHAGYGFIRMRIACQINDQLSSARNAWARHRNEARRNCARKRVVDSSDLLATMRPMTFKGHRSLIIGVANERSLAWAIAQKLHEGGAELGFTYLDERL